MEVASLASVYDYLAREIFTEEPWLRSFNGASHEAIRQQFREYDRKIISLQRQKIASRINQNTIPPGVRGAKAADYTELALIKKEANKKTRHIPIRQLIKRAGQALIALKPCFMMSPLSVAQYLEPGHIEFDLVVMDEASQVKPEDALGAIARGRQIVIVGDPKQLPPTSFFDKMNFDPDDEDQTIIEESESILEAMLSHCKTRRLRWHYRSRHEDLIKFSNYKFYDADLVVFPSPHSESAEFGVKFRHITKGCFVNQRNVEEAEVIAQAVRNHFQNNPKESLGVVAMSQQQSEQINRSVEELTKQDSLFNEAHKELQKSQPDSHCPEEEAIDTIVEAVELLEESVKDYSISPFKLRRKLADYGKIMILKKYPKTPPENRLLCPRMVDELANVQPTSKWEFDEKIPKWLKENINIEEKDEFLQLVLNIIKGHQATHSGEDESFNEQKICGV